MASTSNLPQDGARLLSCSTSWQYDVFLSFRGADTRNGFVDHLYSALYQKLIFTFKDDEELERGESISPALLKAIEESRFAVVVFSENYASSKWCLEELVKILECQKTRALIVLPVFYKVDPSNLRKQTGRVGEAFDKHERDSNEEKVQRWKNALAEATSISGWKLEKDGREAKMVQDIAIGILNRLGDNVSGIFEDVVGLYPRVGKVMSLLEMKPVLDDRRVVGICGMGGIGKTTVAKAVYYQIHSKFHASCYLPNVRENADKHGLESLQKDLLSQILSVSDSDIKIRNIDGFRMLMNKIRHKRVLVVLDDVDHSNQLDNLVGRLDWFGQGSRIIMTTRDIHLLTKYEESHTHIYNVEGLSDEEAFKLFYCKAFKNSQPTPGFEQLIESAIDYAKGVPLALRVLGCFLRGRKKKEWQSAIDRLREGPNQDIQEVLKVSYDKLEHTEQEIFLDIACFFKWYNMEYDTIVNTLNACGFHADIGIRVLEDKALVSMEDNMIYMHDLIQQMGWHIVNEKSPKEPGRRSRLWKYKDIYHTLTKKTGTEAVETIVLNSHKAREMSLSPDTFSKMSNLRLLKLSNIQLLDGLDYLSNDLCILDWHGYPLKYLSSNFQPDSLVTLKMQNSCLEQPWNGRMCIGTLNYVDLSYSPCITKNLDFTQVTNLKELILNDCTNLVEIDPSIEALKMLTVLDLWGCKELTSLPSGICGLKHLVSLIVSGCSKLSSLPENLGGLERLEELSAGFTVIKRLPSSIIHLKQLEFLKMSNCEKLKMLPDLPTNIREIEVGGCASLETLPGCIRYLEQLQNLNMGNCKKLKTLPDLPSNICEIELDGCTSLETLPESIRYLEQLQHLNMRDCKKLKMLPDLPTNIREIQAGGCTSLETLPESIRYLEQLQYLNMRDCKKLKTLPDLPTNIRGIEADGCTSLETLPESIRYLDKLHTLVVMNCKKLKTLPDLPTNIYLIKAGGCTSLETLPKSMGYLDKLHILWLMNCTKLKTLPDLPTNIYQINASGCTSLETLQSVLPRKLMDVSLASYTLAKNRPSLLLELLELLRNYLKEGSVSFFHAVVSGREIPKGFRYQNNKGHYVRIQLEADWYQRLRGFLVCAVYETNAPSIDGNVIVECYDIPYGSYGDNFSVGVYGMRNDDVVYGGGTVDTSFKFQSDLLFLNFITFGSGVRYHLDGSGRSKEEVNDLKTWTEIIVYFNGNGPDLLFPEKCAVHMVYENEEEWPDPRASIQPSELGESQSELSDTFIEYIRGNIRRKYPSM